MGCYAYLYLYFVKLIVKLPKDKLPFIGILYNSIYKAESENQDLVIDHKHLNYRVKFEFAGSGINLYLSSEDKLIQREYRNREYDPLKLKVWFQNTNKASNFNFSHLMDNYGQESVVRTLQNVNKLFLLKVNSYEIITEDTL